MPSLSAIHRHPVKAASCEALDAVALRADETLPGDRLWALVHEKSRLEPDGEGWARCTTFLRGATSPALMAVTSRGGPGGAVTFMHPERAPLSVDPSTEAGEAAFIAWIAPLIPEGLPRPLRLHRAARGITDSRDKGMVSLMSDRSLAALSAAMGLRLDRRRFRGNLWLADLPAWEEFALAGRRLRIGGAVLEILEPIERCSATLANPETGRRDADVLGGLARHFDHADFGMKARVVEGGPVALGDAAVIL